MTCRAERLAVSQMVSAWSTASPGHVRNSRILASQVLYKQEAQVTLSWTLQRGVSRDTVSRDLDNPCGLAGNGLGGARTWRNT